MDPASDADSGTPPLSGNTPARLALMLARLQGLKGPIAAIAAVGTLVGGLAGYLNGWRALRSGWTEGPAVSAKAAAPIAPYSAADRRMTFAVLPFQAPSGDAEGARLAQVSFEVAQAEQDANTLWGRVVPRALVEQQMSKPQTVLQLGQSLNVHFLVRGNVTRRGAGYTLDIAIVDAATERVLDQQTFNAEAVGGTTPLLDKSVRDATHRLTYAGLKQEVARARDTRDAVLDVRDLTFRAYVDLAGDNTDRAAVYAATMKSLNRALAMAPEDLLALQVTAQVNLCECIKAWAADNRPMVDIGVAALDKGLTLRPEWPAMQKLRFWQYMKDRRYPEALLVTDALLAKEPDDEEALSYRIDGLLAMGQAKQALDTLLKAGEAVNQGGQAALVYFANGDDGQAARLARKALVSLTRAQRADAGVGYVTLVLAAAESRAGHQDEASKALKDFHDVVPQVQTISQVKAWLGPSWVVAGADAFWTALQRAGVSGD